MTYIKADILEKLKQLATLESRAISMEIDVLIAFYLAEKGIKL